jgi:acyl-CoA synthetase (AMP-forming)/AMP-acid ligase II
VTLLAILASDAIALPLAPSFPTGELQYILDNSQAKVLLSTEKYADKAREILRAGLDREPVFDVRSKIQKGAAGESVKLEGEKKPSSSGMMLYTSGTTARPVCLPSVTFGGWGLR